ncbi:MAG: dipeptidase [Aggregatilineales bacterium]
MLIIDAHQDIAYNALGYRRDYRQSALTHRDREQGAYPVPTIGLPDALLGRVGIVFATLFVAPEGGMSWSLPGANIDYKDGREAYTKALHQMDYYQRLGDEEERIRLLRDSSDLEAVLTSWDDGKTSGEHRQGLVILMEGADPIREPQQFEEWYERGVRIVGLAWTATRYSGGTGAPGGLTGAGYDLLDVMAHHNAILDVSHMAEQAFMESLDRYEGLIIASHSNPRRFCESDRHLSDAMIRLLAERDGVMGVALYNRFLKKGWSYGDAKNAVTLSDVADVIDHVCQITGSAAHIGIGSDFDGGFGAASIPAELDTVGDLLLIADVLRGRGYDDANIAAILGDNWLRPLRACLGT